MYALGWGTSKSGVALRILGVAPTTGEKGVAVKVGETGASHLTPLHTPHLYRLSIGLPFHLLLNDK